jgi:TonB family protein
MAETGDERMKVVTRSLCLVALTAMLSSCKRGEEAVEEPVPMPDPTPIHYPVALWDKKVEGDTEVLIRVNELGDVDSALVAQSSGYAEFDSAAVNGARKLRFTPGRRGDKRVAMWTRIPIRFAQDSTATVGPPRAAGSRNE